MLLSISVVLTFVNWGDSGHFLSLHGLGTMSGANIHGNSFGMQTILLIENYLNVDPNLEMQIVLYKIPVFLGRLNKHFTHW